MLRNRIVRLSLGIAAVLISVPSIANHGGIAGATQFDYAAVDRVELMTRIVNVPVAREECREEPLAYYQPRPYASVYSYTPTIVGGIVGAVVGNQFGSGSGRDWATVAGTTLGASIGRDYGIRRASRPGHSYTAITRRCRVVNDYQQEERADGYLVTYTYNGRQYQTRVPQHPGDRIRVRVNITPAEY
jgi:uncharacterized protein YcfJ